MDDGEAPENPWDASGLRWLRVLVTTLTVTMIAAGLVVIFLFITRWPDPSPALALPDSVQLPPDATTLAVTRGTDWWAVVVQRVDGSEEILLFGSDGALRQTVAVTR